MSYIHMLDNMTGEKYIKTYCLNDKMKFDYLNLMEPTETRNNISESEPKLHSSNILWTLKPDQLPFITGIAPSYFCEYDQETMSKYISKETFDDMLERINGTLYSYWPWAMWYYGWGLVFAIFTWGLTLIFPYLLIREAQQYLNGCIEDLNKEKFRPRGLELVYSQKFWYKSQIDILILIENNSYNYLIR